MNVTETMDRKRQENLEMLKKFCLMDDEFMTKCFEGDTVCIQLVLRIVLGKPDLIVTDVRTQVFVKNLMNRSVRLDVLATEGDGKKINVEIQRSDKGAGRKRARFNSSMLDVNLLRMGEDFEELVETWVVFITERDVLGKGKPLYHIERYIVDTNERFGDGSHILYVNGAYRDESPLGKLMHDFFCANPADMYYDVLADRVRFFKESKEGVTIMSRMIEEMRRQERAEGIEIGVERGIQKGIQKGRAEGREEGFDESLLESIRNLRQNTNWSITRAMDVLEVPEEKRERYRSILEKQ